MSKVVLITGASSGIGKATAQAVVKAGHKVALTARSQDKLDALVSELGTDNAAAFVADATSFKEQQRVFEEAVAHFGQLDVVFANAGTGVSAAGVENGDADEWDNMVDINIKALLWSAKLAMPYLQQTKGQFVLTSSAAGRKVMKGSVYSATKWFAYGFGQNLAEEMKEWGGRCTTIAPGMVNTPFFEEPKEDKLQPEDVADAVVYAIDANQRNSIREVYLMPTN